jgi:hypothetical protein
MMSFCHMYWACVCSNNPSRDPLCCFTGVWEAALHVARTRGKRACGRVLTLLFEVFLFLSPNHAADAKAALLAGNILDIAIDHMANGQVHMNQNGVRLLMHLSQDPQIRKRMCAQRFVDPLMKGLSRFLLKVCANRHCAGLRATAWRAGGRKGDGVRVLSFACTLCVLSVLDISTDCWHGLFRTSSPLSLIG